MLSGDPVLPADGGDAGRGRRLLASLPVLKPVIPDPGARFQLVHEDDVASAFVAGVLGGASPGAYNLAGGGTLTSATWPARSAGTRSRSRSWPWTPPPK